MKEWTRKLGALGVTVLLTGSFAAAQDLTADLPAAHGQGKLDLDIYAPGLSAPRSPADGAGPAGYNWVPGDPHDQRGAPAWVRHLSHAGYAGLGAAGLAASVASGGVAPAIGFGLVAIVQSFLEWREIKAPPEASD
jgi:hypothetical protein